MHYQQRIETDHRIMLGKPHIKGTRITVEHILRKLSEGMSADALLTAYPTLAKEDIYAAIAFSADIIKMEEPLAS